MNRPAPILLRRVASAALALGVGLASTACFSSSSDTQADCETVEELMLAGQKQTMQRLRDPNVTPRDLADVLHDYTSRLREGAQALSNETLREALTTAADKLEAEMEGVLQGGRPDYTVMTEFVEIVAQECQGSA